MVLIQVLLLIGNVFVLIGMLAVCMFMIATLYSVRLDVPFVRTPARLHTLILDALKIQDGDVVYELGSGDGSFTLAAAQQYPHAMFVGIERNPLLYTYARLRLLRSERKNVRFVRENFFNTDLGSATKLFFYLDKSVMPHIYPKLASELRAGTVLASRAFTFAEKEPREVIRLMPVPGHHGEHELFVYEF